MGKLNVLEIEETTNSPLEIEAGLNADYIKVRREDISRLIRLFEALDQEGEGPVVSIKPTKTLIVDFME